jgi:hypothetical protein
MVIPTSSWTASDIANKVRNITGTPSSNQLTNDNIYDYINRYYAYTMPFELKQQVNLQPFNFTTTANSDIYPVSGAFQTEEPMAYANGFPLVFYQDRDIFYQDWPQQYTQDQVATSTGGLGPYTGITQASPVLKGSFFITDGTLVAYDRSDGILYQNTGTLSVPVNTAVGTINYTTGAFVVTFTAVSAAGTLIVNNYQAYQPARPQGVLFYNNELTFRPVPDQVYQITMQGFVTTQQLSQVSQSPIFSEWGQLLALGASLDILMDRGDLLAYNNLYPIFKRFENVALGRYVEQFTNAQSVPRF